MSKPSSLILLGILAILVPFSGIPLGFRSFVTMAIGACVLGIGLSLRARPIMTRFSEVAPPLSNVPQSDASSVDQ